MRELRNENPIFKSPDGDTTATTDGEQTNEYNPNQNIAFNNTGVDAAAPILPYPASGEQDPAYPQTSLSYPPQEGILPPDEVKNAPPYPPQYSCAYLPQGEGEGVLGAASQGSWPGEHEGSTPCAPPLQSMSGAELPPPPAYDEIEAKKKL